MGYPPRSSVKLASGSSNHPLDNPNWWETPPIVVASIFFSIIPIYPQYIPYNPYIPPIILIRGRARGGGELYGGWGYKRPMLRAGGEAAASPVEVEAFPTDAS